jgi:carboxymethylenebutenolidase
MGEWLTYDAPGGSIRAYAAFPKTPKPWPACIIVHGINGCGPNMWSVADDFANDGYFMLAPDIYTNDPKFGEFSDEDILDAAHIGPYSSNAAEFLAKQTPERREAITRARAWVDARPTSTYIDIISAGYRFLKGREDVGAVGCMGFCMGGRLTGELAVTGADLAAGVIYYGGHPKLDLVTNIRCPIEGHYGSLDKAITDRVPEFAAAMKAAGKQFDYYVYEAEHGFSLKPGTHAYNHDAAVLSFQRTKEFLSRTLKVAAMRHAAE